MSDEVQEFFALKQRYHTSNALVQWFLLDEKFEELATTASSPALRKSIREFIDAEKAERARRHKESMERYRKEREEYVVERMAVMERWRQGVVQKSTARGLIAASAWWLTHSSGSPVRAPGHADRVRHTSRGWSIEFGANHFLITRLVQESTRWLMEGFDLIRGGQILNRKFFIQKIKAVAPSCVANYNFDRYDRYEPTRNQLVFGAQAIDIEDAADYLVNAAGITRYSASAD